METTPRIGLPLLVAGQVQKELFHNEALTILDLLVNGSIDGTAVASPPSSPLLGTFYLVAPAGASGAFSGHENELAGWTAGGWRFVAPVEGMRLTERSSGVELAYRAGAWTSGSLRASEVTVGGGKGLGARRIHATASPIVA